MVKGLHQCTLHSGVDTAIDGLEKQINELKNEVNKLKEHNTQRHDEMFQQIRDLKDALAAFKSDVLEKVGKINKVTAILSSVISVACYFLFQFLLRMIERSLGIK